MTRTGFASILSLALAVSSCGDNRPVSPAAPTPTAVGPSGPVPTPPSGELIKGAVYDTAFRPIVGALVEVMDGPTAGLSTTTDGTGGFSLTGTFDETTRFRASKEGHVTATGTLRPSCAACNPHRWIFFYLESPIPPTNIAGDYTLTFIADAACASLPNEMRTRTYAANISPASSSQYIRFALPSSMSRS